MTNLGLHYTFFRQLFEKYVRRDCFSSAVKRLSILCYIKSVCSLSILTCLAFSSPRFLVPYFPFLHFHVLHFCATFSSLAFFSRAVLCRIFHSCIFQPCIFLCAAFSCLAFSVAPPEQPNRSGVGKTGCHLSAYETRNISETTENRAYIKSYTNRLVPKCMTWNDL